MADHGERAAQLEHLHLLKLAAELGEAAISSLVGEWSGPLQPRKWTVAQLRRFLWLEERPTVPEQQLEPDENGSGQGLCHPQENRSRRPHRFRFMRPPDNNWKLERIAL